MINIYTKSPESGETFSENQVSEINEAITKAVEEEMRKQYSSLKVSL